MKDFGGRLCVTNSEKRGDRGCWASKISVHARFGFSGCPASTMTRPYGGATTTERFKAAVDFLGYGTVCKYTATVYSQCLKTSRTGGGRYKRWVVCKRVAHRQSFRSARHVAPSSGNNAMLAEYTISAWQSQPGRCVSVRGGRGR